MSGEHFIRTSQTEEFLGVALGAAGKQREAGEGPVSKLMWSCMRGGKKSWRRMHQTIVEQTPLPKHEDELG